MEIERLSLDALGASLRTGCRYLELNQDILDRLNVFPVPDGDTGVNMVSTLKPAVEELERARCSSLREVAELMRSALARSSRGNSGFILAQFFRGFWEVAGTRDWIEPDTLKRGFARGSFTAVSSLLAPAEGTMISVIDSMARAMEPLDSRNIVSYLQAAVEAGRRSVDQATEQLPLLAEAGVVDAGALGFLFIVKGMLYALLGKEAVAEEESSFRREPVAVGTPSRSRGMEFRYCVELEVEADPGSIDDLRGLLPQLGGSIALMAEGSRIRVHIHTNAPDALLEGLGRHGRVTQRRRDDMAQQIALTGSASRRASPPGRGGGVSVLSIIPGPGFRSLFEELGASDCLEYRESLPSADDVLGAIGRMHGGDVIVLPNNPNIIPTVELAREETERRVHVLRTRTVVEGLTALYGYSESDDAAPNLKSMQGCIGLARTLVVYRASRDTTFGRFRINRGDYFVANGDEVLSTGRSLEGSVVVAAKTTDIAGRSRVSFYCGDGFDAPRLAGIRRGLVELNPRLEFEEHYGGQPKSLLIVAME